jgi:hypothetical protein
MYCVGHRMRSAWRIHSPDYRIYQGWPALGQQVSPQSTHRVATAAFCRTVHHDGIISPGLQNLTCYMQCCGFGMFITDPGSRISDLGSRIQKQQQKRRVKKNKKIVLIPFYVATNFTKL